MKILKKDEIGINTDFCHNIIKKHNKFLVDYNLPNKTDNKLLPSSHLPINFIKSINNEIFNITNNNIFEKISNIYNIDKKDLSINSIFFVNNNYENNKIYQNAEIMNYSYLFIIPLNESSYYDGGEFYINDKIVEINNDEIIICNNNDKIYIREILAGCQLKLFGYINNNLNILNKFKIKNMFIDHIYQIDEAIHFNVCDEIKNTFDISLFDKNEETNIINNITKNDEFISFSIDDYKNIIILQYINNALSNNKKLINILNKYSISYANLLSYRIKINLKSTNIVYNSPFIKNKNNELLFNIKNDAKFTLLININNCIGNITFPDYELSINLKKTNSILIPNNFLYKYYITLENTENNYAYFLEVTFT